MHRAFLALSLLMLSGLAQAQSRPIAPGLWETRVQSPEMEAIRSQMQAALAGLPPAQRAEMEKMMGQQGFQMAAGGGARLCISPEMARLDPTAVAAREGCRQTVAWSGQVARVEYSCQSGQTTQKGRGEFTYLNDKAYSGWMENPGLDGRPMRVTMQAQWLGADCGDIKPLRRQ